MLSSVEFHPQWLQKPPTAGCPSTSICGARFTMYPLSETILLTSFGNESIPLKPRIEPGRMTHKKAIQCNSCHLQLN
ncbi:hypothetical protein CARUB_v10018342mg [Capsella rubella]|uniref:Uncharacterized protein n=1 Tax=Capsella rubella TaxID=81985 RepID=R0FRY4_9BRAS|nr:hypothetical protein CARUB_v10018342mg [Capsella rubella]